MTLVHNTLSFAARIPSTPSIATLKLVFGVRAKEAKLALTTDIYKTYDSVIELKKSCYNPPSKPLCIMTALNEIAGAYGVESFCDADYNPYRAYVDYLNTGDSYKPTILYDGRFKVTTLGDYIERHPKFQ